jgi:hypothetical protein
MTLERQLWDMIECVNGDEVVPFSLRWTIRNQHLYFRAWERSCLTSSLIAKVIPTSTEFLDMLWWH